MKNFKDAEGRSYPFYLYVSLNARDAFKATYKLMQDILFWMYEENKGTDRSRMYKRVDGYFYSALMKKDCRTTSQKYFMIDYDEKKNIRGFEEVLKQNEIEVVIKIEPRNGYHFKVKPYDRRKLETTRTIHFDIYPFEVKTDANIFVEYVENGN